ncbi:hypothetical protein OU994_16795 [Pseudoduganella sp. SL102]|uniref:hypothetical protein n=1 Tax=Pseudoduganella sp. SL102 TaxID=2995154 RepID=UPI00248AEB7F|nr:hypothetical protein [Pseudoduganella sp. SL102]WBR99981.1 hypothetical protein OU994_16795 [Pseudoduganella sp. SL102]
MNEIPSVENYQYLWDGSQPGWVLQCLSGHYVDLSLTFGSVGPSNAELMAARRTVPEYASLPLNEVLAELRGRHTLPLGRFLSDEARNVAATCRRQGLCVLEAVIKAPRYLPTNEVSQTVLLIEDDAIAREVFALALQHGVPVRHVEF